MQENEINDWDAQALAYLAGQMDDRAERNAFEKRLDDSSEGRDALSRARAVLDAAGAASDAAVSRTVTGLLAAALDAGGSDLHFVAEKNGVVVRVRVGGVLREHARLPQALHQAVVDWWKAKINASLVERQRGQNGTMTLTHQNEEFGLSVVVLPQFWGETVMVRLLNRSTLRLGLDNLGLRSHQTDVLRRLIQLPNGLVLTSGPKASGKTTLLYSLLMEVAAHGPERSILTVEEPIEMVLPGLGQTAASRHAGFTKADALRSFLRADSDVIYCAALENEETARLAIEAALAGNLVLSVVPGATSAWDALARLQNMGLDNFLLSATVVGLIGQRRVRVFAPDAPTEQDTPHPADLATLGLSPEEDGPFLRPGSDTLHHGFTHEKAALLEIVEMNAPLAQAITAGATANELWAASSGQGGSLRDEAARLVREKRTSVNEAARSVADYPHSFAPVVFPTASSVALQTLTGYLPPFGRG